MYVTTGFSEVVSCGIQMFRYVNVHVFTITLKLVSFSQTHTDYSFKTNIDAKKTFLWLNEKHQLPEKIIVVKITTYYNTLNIKI